MVVKIVGILFRLNSISIGIRYMKLGMVCMMFSSGISIVCRWLLCVVRMFRGMLISIEMKVVISISVRVCISLF